MKGAFDGERSYTLSPKHQRGESSISGTALQQLLSSEESKLPHQVVMAAQGLSPTDWLDKVLRDGSALQLQSTPKESIVELSATVDIGTIRGVPDVKQLHEWKVQFDLLRGFNVVAVDLNLIIQQGTTRFLAQRSVVDEIELISDAKGIAWYPEKFRVTKFQLLSDDHSRPVGLEAELQATHVTFLNSKEIRLNQDISDELFRVALPEGTLVRDSTKDTVYVVGTGGERKLEATSGKLQKLLYDPPGSMIVRDPATHVPKLHSNSVSVSILWIGASVLVVILLSTSAAVIVWASKRERNQKEA